MTIAAAQRVERRYGFPLKGFVTSLDRHEIPLDFLNGESRDLLTEPSRGASLGKVKRRHGAAGVGSANGVLEMAVANATMRSLESFELPTLVSADGYPVLAQIWADESKRYGQLWLRDGADYTEGEEFGALHYPAAGGGSTQNNLKMPPGPYDGNGATGYMRMAFEEARRRTIAGTRRHVGVKNREYFGGFYSYPSNNNREYNLSSVAGSNNLRHFPTGLIPPLYPATHAAGQYPAASAAVQAWKMGDVYFEAWAFEYEDGSVSMPFIPRDKQGAGSTLPSGLGLVTVNDTGAGQYYAYVPDRDVPRGPPGTRKRRKYRSNKVSAAAIAAGSAYPDISTLKLCAIIEDNTSTSYNDPRGNDGALVSDPLLRTDQVWPARGRYDWAFDQRHATGYLRPNPCAIIVAPTATPGGTSRGINQEDDDAALVGATAMLVQVRQDSAGAMTLRLRATAFGAAAPVNTTITLDAATSLQSVVDQIGATTPGSTGGEWAAQIVPGANANAPSTNLAPSHIDRAGGTWTNASPTLNITNATDVAEGMKVNDPLWPAGTFVKSKAGNVLTMSANSTGAQAVGADVEFYADTGDDPLFTDATAHSQYGNMRAYGGCVPVIIGFKQSYLDTFPTEKRDFMMTTAGPTQRPNAAHLFHTSPGGRYTAESAAGIFMGGAPLHQGFVAFYSKRIGWYHNVRSGSTGEDQDYRMDWVDFEHGCKSPYSIIHGNGWVGCWRDDGFWIFDGEKSAVISGDHFRVTTGGAVGDFAYEAGLCNAAAAADTNDMYMHAHYVDGRLWLNLRVSAGVGADYCYDCSASIEASGIAQVLDPEGNPYGWSARCSYSWRSASAGCLGAIGSVRKSDGIHLYQGDDKNDKTTCGLVQEFETTGAYLDGAGAVAWILYLATDLLGGMKKSSLVSPWTFLYKNTVSSGATGITGSVYRNQARTAVVPISLPLTGTDVFTRKAVNLGLKAGSPGEVAEVKLVGGALAAELVFELTGVAGLADILDSLT